MCCLLMQFIVQPPHTVHLNIRHGRRSFVPCENRTSYHVSHAVIGGSLMRSKYIETMNEVLIVLGKQPLICFTLDGATNLQGKQVINMMACVPKAYFLEQNLLDKLLDCKL
jgi:hypothetical protein